MALNLPKLQRNLPIAGDFPPTEGFHIWWQQVVSTLVHTINSQQDQIADIQEALDNADEAKRNTARVSSYTIPTVVLSGEDAGTDAKIVVAAHQRIYPSDSGLTIPPVNILTADITGLAFSTEYFVYYDDATLTDTTPSFQTTTNAATAQVGAAPDRHFVGVVTTPADGGGSTGGTGGFPPGGGGGNPIP